MQTVVCFGDSITRGQISANYVDMLAGWSGLRGFRFYNAGVNSDLTLNLLRRVKRVAARQPDYVVIMIGTNDVIATVRPFSAAFFFLVKGMLRPVNLTYSMNNLTKVIHYLRRNTNAQIALCSIPPLGEGLSSAPMQLVRLYNAALRKLAEREGAAYLPVFERQSAYLQSLNGSAGRVYNGSVFLTAEFVLRHLLLGETYERFSARKGFTLLTDGVHLNRKAAAMLALEIEKYLRGYPSLPEEQAQPQSVQLVR